MFMQQYYEWIEDHCKVNERTKYLTPVLLLVCMRVQESYTKDDREAVSLSTDACKGL